MVTRTLYLLRHGHYQEWKNKETPLEGHLTSWGQEQAEITAEFFGQKSITAIHCSTLNRAVETCRVIAEKFSELTVRRTRVLWECVPVIPPMFADHYQGYPREKVEKAEAQAEKAFERYFGPTRGEDKQEIIVAHGNLIRYLVCRALKVDPKAWGYMYTDNCGISKLLIKSDGTVRLVYFNFNGHLPPRLRATERDGGLAETMYLAAQLARKEGRIQEAHRYAEQSISLFYSLESNKESQVRAWVGEVLGK